MRIVKSELATDKLIHKAWTKTLKKYKDYLNIYEESEIVTWGAIALSNQQQQGLTRDMIEKMDKAKKDLHDRHEKLKEEKDKAYKDLHDRHKFLREKIEKMEKETQQ